MILHYYFARRFLMTFLGLFVVFMVLVALINLVDDLHDFPDMPFARIIKIVLLKLPHATYEILPLIVILSTVTFYISLARSSELVVIRASGRSALRGLLAPLFVAAMIGFVSVTLFNPIVAATSKQRNNILTAYRGDGSSVLAIALEGIWLRQGSAAGQTVIHAAKASSDVSTLYDATFMKFSPDGRPLQRIWAKSATLGSGEWQLEDAKVWSLAPGGNPEATAVQRKKLLLPSELTRNQIIDSFGEPEYIAIWDLQPFITQLEQAGFSARRYAVWFQAELARPLFLMAMVLISASLTMRPTRLSNAGLSVLSAVMLGFSLHYIRNFALILGSNGQIPILLAAWAPHVASLLLAFGLLLHMEEG